VRSQSVLTAAAPLAGDSSFVKAGLDFDWLDEPALLHHLGAHRDSPGLWSRWSPRVASKVSRIIT